MARDTIVGATYTLVIKNAQDSTLAIKSNFNTLAYSRSVNVPGTLTFNFDTSLVDRSIFTRDVRIEIWRGIAGGVEYLETGTQWLLRKRTFNFDQQMLEIQCQSALDVLRRRVIAYDAGSSQSSKNDLADNVIVEFVKENLGSSATDSDRDISDKITVFGSSGLGPTVRKSASRRNLLTTIQEVAQQANVQGTPVYFDLDYNVSAKTQEFKIFINVRGSDITTGTRAIVFSPEYGNLINVVQSDEFTNEVTFVYAAGQGLASDRNIQTASDVTRIGLSPFGRIEALADSRQTNNDNGLIAEAESKLTSGRPLRTISGTIINKPGSLYGVDWNWGDKVTVEIEGEVFTARINTISVDVSGGKETITADIRIED